MAFSLVYSANVFTGTVTSYGEIKTEGAIDFLAPTGEDIVFKLGDDAGANKLSIIDSGGAEVASIDSNGTISGTISSTASTIADVAGGILYLNRNDLTVVASNDIGSIVWSAKDTDVSAGVYQPVASIIVTAAEDFDDANDAGSNFNFWNCEIGSEAMSLNMQLNATGTLKIDHIEECNGAHGLIITSGWSAVGQTCADLGSVTTCDINGGNIDATAIGVTTPSTASFDEVFITESTGATLSIGRADLTVSNADVIGTISFIAKDTDAQGGAYESVASIKCIVIEDFDDADDAGTKFSFSVNSIGSETPQEEMALSGERLQVDHIGELTGAHGLTFDSGWTAAGQTCVDAGILTTVDINGGTLDGVAIGGAATAAATLAATTLVSSLQIPRVAVGAATDSAATSLYFGCASVGSDTITLKSSDIAMAGRVFIIKDEGNNASVQPITIVTEAAETIDGADSVQIITNGGYLWLYSDGSNLFIINSD